MGLFRKEVADAQRDRLHGQVVLLPRWPHTLVTLFLIFWVGAVLAFLTQASYSRKETVRGWLEPVDGVVQVFAQSEGKLAKLLVQPGEAVVSGQPLAVINGDRVLADGEHLETILLAEYERQRDALRRQLDRQAVLAELRSGELADAIDNTGSTLAAIDTQLATIERREDLVRKRLDRHEQLASKGHITESELEMLEEQALLLAGEKQELQTARTSHVARLESLQAELSRLPQETDNAMDRLRLSLSDLSQEIAKLRGNRAYVLQAPVEGTVSRIDMREGQRARYDAPVITLLPKDSPLVVQLLVPVRAAGFIAPGQDLKIRYDAFPYQKYGLQPGQLTGMSDSALMPDERARLPVKPAEPVFRASAVPAQHSILAHGQRVELKAGMTLSADIVLERRSILEWLLEPLYSLRGRLT